MISVNETLVKQYYAGAWESLTRALLSAMGRLQKSVREAAISMIERYGRNALQQIDQRIRELQDHHEDEAVFLWQEVQIAVETLLSDRKDDNSHK